MSCHLPCCRVHMAQDRSLNKTQKPSVPVAAEGPVAKGVVVATGGGYLAVGSEICGLEALEIGSIPPMRRFKSSAGECRERASTPPCQCGCPVLGARCSGRPFVQLRTLCFRCGCAKLWRSKCLAGTLASKWPAHDGAC